MSLEINDVQASLPEGYELHAGRGAKYIFIAIGDGLPMKGWNSETNQWDEITEDDLPPPPSPDPSPGG